MRSEYCKKHGHEPRSEPFVLGDRFGCRLDLYNAAPDHLKHFVAKRRDDYLTPVFLAAYLLDHRYEGKKLEAYDTKKPSPISAQLTKMPWERSLST